ncbi:MAG TPA: prepilin-type N-terminal cleavage/methylation domain-containing protein [Pirellulales bacterium]|nr:prepilin-type N-terminal cleavage/methylation domain-containing protein [Pirellulales bacterium]
MKRAHSAGNDNGPMAITARDGVASMHPSSRCRSRRRPARGFSLLEVVLALAILTVSIAVLGELVRSGLRSAQLARDVSQAAIICESTIYQIEAGLLPPQSVQGAPVDQMPGWYYSIEPENTGAPGQAGLLKLRVTAEQSKDQHTRPTKYSVVRWLRDPSLVLAQQAAHGNMQQNILPSTLPINTSSSSSSTMGTGSF